MQLMRTLPLSVNKRSISDQRRLNKTPRHQFFGVAKSENCSLAGVVLRQSNALFRNSIGKLPHDALPILNLPLIESCLQ